MRQTNLPDRSVGRDPGAVVAAACLAALVVFALAGCAGRAGPAANTSPATRDATIRRIALDYVRDGSLTAAQTALSKLNLANPAQLTMTLAEQAITEGKPADEVKALARLADALGSRSPKLIAYLAPTVAPTPLPRPTDPPPSPSSTAAPTVTPLPPTATALPPAATPTATATIPAQKPRVVADAAANLRGGPGTNYPMIGQMTPGKEVDIIGRNSNGDWWRIAWEGASQAWVAGLVVRVLGPIDTVPAVRDVPPPPPTNTPAPAAPAPSPTPAAAAKPAVDYRIVEQRLLTISENGGCMGKHSIFFQVVDLNGAPVNGAVVQRVTSAETATAGGDMGKDCFWHLGVRNEGCGEFDIYGGGDQVKVIADPTLGQVTSEVSRKISTQDADQSIDELLATGYCPEGRANCIWRQNPGNDLKPQLCNGHYSGFIKFQRTR